MSARAPFAELDHTDPSELLYAAWQVIANVGVHQDGWEGQHPEWLDAAKAWRDAWHRHLTARPDMQPAPEGDASADLPIEVFRKRAIKVQAILWDGTPERAALIKQWVGTNGNGEVGFLLPDDEVFGTVPEAIIWNDQEGCWVSCPVGHRVVRGRLGEFYPVSPEAVAETYDPVRP